MDNNEREKYLSILKEELLPALGCTEPIALAYAASKCREILGQEAEVIEAEREENGDLTDLDEFLVRCKHRAVNKKVLDALEDAGALCFNKKKWLKQVEKYNTSILARR